MQDRKLSKNLGSQLNMYEILSLVALALLFCIPLYYYDSLPEKVPMHFDAKGLADRFGAKKEIWMVPGIGAFLYIFLTLIARIKFYPKTMDNRPMEIQLKEHQLGLDIVLILKMVILALLAGQVYFICKGAIAGTDGIPSWYLPFFLITIFGVIGWNLRKIMALK